MDGESWVHLRASHLTSCIRKFTRLCNEPSFHVHRWAAADGRVDFVVRIGGLATIVAHLFDSSTDELTHLTDFDTENHTHRAHTTRRNFSRTRDELHKSSVSPLICSFFFFDFFLFSLLVRIDPTRSRHRRRLRALAEITRKIWDEMNILFFFALILKRKVSRQSRNRSHLFSHLKLNGHWSSHFFFVVARRKVNFLLYFWGEIFSDFPLLPLSHRARRSPLIQSEYKTVFILVSLRAHFHGEIQENNREQKQTVFCCFSFDRSSKQMGKFGKFSLTHRDSSKWIFSLFFTSNLVNVSVDLNVRDAMRSPLDHLREFVQALFYFQFSYVISPRAR